jgi:hypothetical protein
MKTKIIIFLLTVLASGCAGKFDYIKPTTSIKEINSITINQSRDSVWNAAVPSLGKQFFVINNLDKSSGLINLSYVGDPEKYVDCGRIISYVKNMRGERTYDFSASKAEQQYEVMEGNLMFANRKMGLEGRINLIFEEITPNQTKVTANTKYIISRTLTVRDISSGASQTANDSISFNSGTSAAFAPNNKGQATECVPTGKLEDDILKSIK